MDINILFNDRQEIDDDLFLAWFSQFLFKTLSPIVDQAGGYCKVYVRRVEV